MNEPENDWIECYDKKICRGAFAGQPFSMDATLKGMWFSSANLTGNFFDPCLHTILAPSLI
jgi:hypothetical protein